MPFTGSHPAAVLPLLGLPAVGAPLAGLRLVPAGLVAGSMAPDLPIFVPLPISPARAHALTGIVSVDLVVAAALAVGWRGFVQPVLLAAAPTAVRARLGPDFPPSTRSLSRALADLAVWGAVGAATHIGWDAFTHAGRWGTRRSRWLRADHGSLSGYAWAQYGSGVVGLVAMAVWTTRWYRRTPAVPEPTAVARLAPSVVMPGRRLS